MHKTFCLHCQKKTKDVAPKIVKTKNGGRRLKSTCAVCGTKKSEFVAKSCPL